jgi:hypothetical protein
LHGAFFKFRTLFSEELIALLLVLFVFAVPAGATTRFENRSLFMNTTEPAVTTSYKLSLNYMTPEPVGSLDLLFCISPIPYEPCVVPPGLDVSNAVMSDQEGEIGFSILSKDVNHIILTRPSSMIISSSLTSSYTFDNIKNPTDTTKSFSIRLKSHSSTNATGPLIDFGSVKGQVGKGIVIETQVPPMLIFCAAREVEMDCSSTDETYFSDMGDLTKDSTLTAQSQMAVGTNATAGFVITANGNPLTAGTNTIDGLGAPTDSIQGKNQFGINLVANNELNIGNDPEGVWANGVPSPDYNQPNMFKYVTGDVVAYSPNVSLMRKFTVSYVVNVSPSLRAGVYTTTINYIASGRF